MGSAGFPQGKPKPLDRELEPVANALKIKKARKPARATKKAKK